jgi:exopolysaccharide/PEP-CTERM locus tyrosine autokinase
VEDIPMSRIEKALKKAIEMRESAKETIAEETIKSDSTVLSTLEVPEMIVSLDRVERNIVCITDPSSGTAEQYKKLRAKILNLTAKNFLNTIMVTSPDMGDGKSITAMNLAATLAQKMDYTVLLIDADLRHPSILKLLGIKSNYGLSDYLVGKVDLPDILIKTGIGKLVIMPAGNATENSVELLSSEAMKRLVHEIKHRYKDRYIIFDAPPIIAVADTLPLSNYVDGVLLVIQAARTTPKTALHAISQIKGSNILGVVFNKVPSYLVKNLYPYYRDYGQYYAKAEKMDSMSQGQ